MMEVSTREIYGKTLVKIGEVYKDVVVLDADVSRSTMTKYFAERFPDRFFNCGIQEANMIGVAAGLATCGKIVFASTFAVFASGRAWDQVRMLIAYSGTNVKIVATHGGVTVGEDGYSHHSLNDIALMRSLPGMVVIVPCDGYETESVLWEIVKYNGPVYVRLGRAKVKQVYNSLPDFKIGKGVVLKEGKDVLIVACGIMTYQALVAAELLANDGIHPTIINISTIKPIDSDLILKYAKDSKLVITAEEHSIVGGLGDAVSEVLTDKISVKIKRIGIKDIFSSSGSVEDVLKSYGLTPEDLVLAVKKGL